MIIRTTLVALLSAAVALPVLADVRLYRYRNADGNVVVDYRVPAEYVAGGYEVLNDEGVVVEVVPRELTPEEREAADAQLRLEEEARAELERLRAWDESLLMRYSTTADIEAARKRALDDLRIRVSILKGNRRSLKQRIENYQAEAAQMERGGRTVDDARLQVIRELQHELASTERAITDRQGDIEELSATFQEDIERFQQLQDMVELRRSLSAPGGR